MWLKKDKGGTTITWEGLKYNWPAGDPVCEVPGELGETLLNIHGAGYTQVPAPPKPAPAPVAPKPAPAATAQK